MARRRGRKALGPEGIILVDKPLGPTSRDVVNDLRRRLDLPGPGHCGTLDPLASGLLVLVSGHATRVQDRLTGHDKTYVAHVRFGASSVTDDEEGPIHEEEDPLIPTRGEVNLAVERFLGEIQQTPPMHSAIKVGGERLYKAARRGETKEIPVRTVVIHKIAISSYEWPNLELTVDCGSGTYIRSLARDLGESLSTQAYLAGLRRTRCGAFSIEDAVSMEDIDVGSVQSLEHCLSDWPRIEIPTEKLADLLQGKEIIFDEGVVVDNDALLVCNEQIVGRSKKLGDHSLRMKRLIKAPPSQEPPSL